MRFLSARTLGIIGIIGAPWLFIDFINNGLYDRFVLTSESGIRNFLFITVGPAAYSPLPNKSNGHKTMAKNSDDYQLVLLCLSNCWNIWGNICT